MTRLLILALMAAPLASQDPLTKPVDAVQVRYADWQPDMHYTIRVDTADLSGFDVELRLRNVPDSFMLAMVAHPEYDDRYWRYLDGPHLAGATITRRDSALWRVVAPRQHELVIRYRLRLPPEPRAIRAAWKPFLASTGGLIGGPHSFLYVVGATLAPAYVTLDLPAGWDVATGLERTADPRVFFAPSIGVLMDSPILIGHFSDWRFAVDGVPHRIVYWRRTDAQAFDTAKFVDGVRRITEQAVALFGRAPYRDFTFLYQDGAYGALEHKSSVTLGAPSEDLARDPNAYLEETAHEFFHTWNLMRIHPAEYGDVSYRPQALSKGLWVSEGFTMFYADLLMRRAGLPNSDSTRIAHLERILSSYLANPAYTHFSAERVSQASYSSDPGFLPDYSASTHLQGEVLGAMIDLIMRNATQGRRSLDDVMHVLLERYSGDSGFTTSGIEATVHDLCRCAVRGFFDSYVRGVSPIDFDRYLGLIGLRARVTWGPARNRDGTVQADLRAWGYVPVGASGVTMIVGNPESVWGRAGLHTGDRVVTLNGTSFDAIQPYRAFFGQLKIGDTVRVEVARGAGTYRTMVVITGYDVPTVRLEELPDATPAQRALREGWMRGN